MNVVALVGRLTKDPDLRYTPDKGTAVATVTIAVDRRTSNKDGQREADFIPVVIWGKSAENTANHMSKGRMIGITGRIQTRSYDAKDGTKRYVTEVVASEVQFLSKKPSGSSVSTGEEDIDPDMIPVDDGDTPF